MNSILEVCNIKANMTEIAKGLGVDRRTVKKYLSGYQKPKNRTKTSKIDKFVPLIRELLKDSNIQKFHYKTNLYNYLVENYDLDVSSSTFRHYIKNNEEFNSYFSKNKRTSPAIKCMRYETEPGEQAQIDWKENFKFMTCDCGLIEINIFVFLLSYSRYSFYLKS